MSACRTAVPLVGGTAVASPRSGSCRRATREPVRDFIYVWSCLTVKEQAPAIPWAVPRSVRSCRQCRRDVLRVKALAPSSRATPRRPSPSAPGDAGPSAKGRAHRPVGSCPERTTTGPAREGPSGLSGHRNAATGEVAGRPPASRARLRRPGPGGMIDAQSSMPGSAAGPSAAEEYRRWRRAALRPVHRCGAQGPDARPG